MCALHPLCLDYNARLLQTLRPARCATVPAASHPRSPRARQCHCGGSWGLVKPTVRGDCGREELDGWETGGKLLDREGGAGLRAGGEGGKFGEEG